jgi:hypothetical protein
LKREGAAGGAQLLRQPTVAVTVAEEAGHRLGVTDVRQRSGDDRPIEAGQHAADVVLWR